MDRRDYLQEEIDRELRRGAEITRDIRRTTAETLDVSKDTARTVHQQGEQLNRVERRLDGIKGDLKESHHHLREVESFWYSWLPKSFKQKLNSRPTASSPPRDSGKGAKKTSSAPQKTASSGVGSKERFVQRTVGHPLEDQMNEDLDCVDGMLDDILQTASETGRELDHQNVQLGRMNKKVDDADTNITGLNIRMNRQIRK